MEVRQSPSSESRFFYGYIIVGAALCIMVAIWGAYFAFGVFFKPVLTEFGWTRAMTSGALSLSMIVYGLIGAVMGGLNDRFGPRVVITLGGFIIGLGYLLMALLNAVWQLYLFYGIIIGVGMGSTWIPLLSTVARWFAKRRSMMSGIVLAGTGIGTFIAPPVANWLISIYDWRISYIILGSVASVVVILTAQLLRRDPSQMGQVPYGENECGEQRLNVGAEGFSLNEAVHTRQFWVVFAMFILFGFCMFAIMLHIVPHAIELGISAANAAIILSTIGGASIFGRVVLGSAADRIGNRQIFIIGFILMSATLFWLVPATEMWRLYLFAGAFGFAHGGMGPSESPLIARLFGLKSHGLIYGVAGLGFTTGAALGPFLTGYIFDVTGSYQFAFLVCAVIGIIGLVSAIVIRPIRGGGAKQTI